MWARHPQRMYHKGASLLYIGSGVWADTGPGAVLYHLHTEGKPDISWSGSGND